MPPKGIRRSAVADELEDGASEPGVSREGKKAMAYKKLRDARRTRNGGLDAEAQLRASEASKSGRGAGRLEETFQGGMEEGGADEDPLVERYVEKELKRRRGEEDADDLGEGMDNKERRKKALYETPRELTSERHVEEEGPERWLTGIVEVELPLEQRLESVEATEAAKARMIERQAGKAPAGNSFEGAQDQQPQKDLLRQQRRMLPKRFGRQRK